MQSVQSFSEKESSRRQWGVGRCDVDTGHAGIQRNECADIHLADWSRLMCVGSRRRRLAFGQTEVLQADIHQSVIKTRRG